MNSLYLFDPSNDQVVHVLSAASWATRYGGRELVGFASILEDHWTDK